MKKINFINNSEPYLSAENLNQLQNNIENAINEIGNIYSYDLTPISVGLTSNSWVKIANDLTTDVIPKGKYLLIYAGTLGGATNGVATLNPCLDGTRLPAYTRQSIPISSLTTSGQCSWYVEFKENSTHTVNLYQYADVTTSSSYVAVYFIRIG